jgi:phenylalanyl-tRNA synthetase alpha chain
MQKAIDDILTQANHDFSNVSSTTDVENIRIKFLGRKGPIQQLMQLLKDVAPEERPAAGKKINDLKETISTKCTELANQLIEKEEHSQLENEKIDITLPGRKSFIGRKHIVNQVLDRMVDILIEMGFSVQYGPHVESDYYNFEVLNMDKDHPARDMQDTFYITPEALLRTHTTNIQARVMEKNKPPIRIIAPGRVYRNESISARSHVFFHQVDGLYIDRNVTFADLLSTMDEFMRKLFGRELATRYRPSYFPFVEPGLEIDIECLLCNGKGCQLCKHTGWLEVAGAGMVHPEVLKNCGIDPEEFTGFAWGMGVERLVLIKHGVTDIRLFAENDVRFLSQFTGCS